MSLPGGHGDLTDDRLWEPIITPEGTSYVIDWDGEGTDVVQADDTGRVGWWER